MRDRTRIFLSYSRRDFQLAQSLRDRLIADGFDAYLDVHDIVKGEPWQDRLRSLVEASDAVLFLISPDAIASEICEWEVNEAERLAKRLFPVVVRATPTADIPQRLQRLNFTFLDREDAWQAEFALLLAALKEDVEWVREHTRLGELAVRWERAGRPKRNLLRGADLAAAERWRDTQPASAPPLSSLLAEFLRRSREVSQRRLRSWLIAVTLLAVFAVGLSTFAYWQRELAEANARVAERRAAALATDVAITRAGQGAYNESLLLLLDASTRYASAQVPEKLKLALRDVTDEAARSRTFWFSPRARAFHLPEAIIVTDPDPGVIWLVDPLGGERREVAAYAGYDIIDMAIVDRSLVFLGDDGGLYRVATEPGPGNATGPVRLASLRAAGEHPVTGFTPLLIRAGSSSLVGERVFRRDDVAGTVIELWRFDLETGQLQRFDIAGDAGRLLRADARAAYFGHADDPGIDALEFDTGELLPLRLSEAVERGVSPCRQQSGMPPASLLKAVFETLRPGFERVECAGIYGDLALMSRERAFARWMRDEYFLLPSGTTAEQASRDYLLLDAVEWLGALESEKPFGWYAGSAEGARVAVSHADRILLLARDATGFQAPMFFADGRLAAQEVATPEVTDGGAFYDIDRFAYSGTDGRRYRVTVLGIQSPPADAMQVTEAPMRAYRGSCGIQNPQQGDGTSVQERPFAVERAGDGTHLVRLGDRRFTLPLDEVRCASASADGSRLAVLDGSGVRLFDLGRMDDLALPAQVGHIQDPTIRTVSFAGDRQQLLLAVHRHKVTTWERRDAGEYVAETVYRSTRPVLFAEGAPDAPRMLVWLAKATAEASVEVVPIPHAGRAWFKEELLWLVNRPDLFFGTDGSVYRVEDGKAYRVMPAVQLATLVEAAERVLSPGCIPTEPGAYRSSRCWPTSR